MDKETVRAKKTFSEIFIRAMVGIRHHLRSYVLSFLRGYGAGFVSAEPGLPRLRDKLFITFLLWAFPIGFVAYVPSIVLSIDTREVAVAIADTFAMGIVTFVFYYRGHDINVKKRLFAIAIYVLGVVLLLNLGTMGPGMLILFALSVLVTLFYSKKAGVVSVIMNGILYFLLLIATFFFDISLPFFYDYTPDIWLVVGLNFVAFNAIIVFSLSFLVNHLQRRYLNELRLHKKLQHERKDLAKAKEKAEESDRLKSVFLANISHEISTPMSMILGFADLLKQKAVNDFEQLEYIDAIEENGHQMVHLMKGLIMVSQIETAQVQLNNGRFRLNAIIDELKDGFAPLARAKQNLLKIEKGGNDEVYWFADRSKIEQVLTNLLKNAIRYTRGGTITLGYRVETNQLVFWVKDTGIGIPEPLQAVIFDRFRQVKETTHGEHEGVGLGLTVCKAFVEMMGGEIVVESTEGEGAAFYFYLPYRVIF